MLANVAYYNCKMGQQQFCYWDAKSLEDTILMGILMIIIMIMGGIALYRLLRVGEYGLHGRSMIVIYALIVGWSVFSAMQYAYSLVIYFQFIEDELKPSVDEYSRMFVRLNVLPGFLVQTIFLQVCRFYYRGLTNSLELSKLSRWQQKYIHYLNGYFLLRILNQTVGVILVNIFANTSEISFYSTLNVWILICDSLIINVFLGLSLKIYLRRFAEVGRLQIGDLLQLRKEYRVMIGTSVMRVIIDLVFLGLPIVKGQCIGPIEEHLAQSILYTLFGNLVNHLLPILWVLKIYNPHALSNQGNSQLTPLINSFVNLI